MKMPVIKGIIKRRLLINFLVDPNVISKHLPAMFSPKIIKGKAVIGICLIKLENIRPKTFPFNIGINSENVAHRIAVQWTDPNGDTKDGVYIFRRDSNSWLNTILGGRLFPGNHNHARFKVKETKDYIDMRINSLDNKVNINMKTQLKKDLVKSKIFGSIDELSDFFKTGADGYSPMKDKNCYQGMCLIPFEWNMRIVQKENLEVSYFTEVLGLTNDDLIFDSIVLMQNIPHEWRSLKDMKVTI